MKNPIVCADNSISKNYAMCLQIGRHVEWAYINFSFRWSSIKFQDHAGPDLNIEIFGFHFIFYIYNKHHYDKSKKENG